MKQCLLITDSHFLPERQKVNTHSCSLGQWFLNFSGAQTTYNILVLREAENIDLCVVRGEDLGKHCTRVQKGSNILLYLCISVFQWIDKWTGSK